MVLLLSVNRASFTRTFLDAASEAGLNTYMYYFSHESTAGLLNAQLGNLKAGHGYEINYIFHNKNFGSKEESYLSFQMMKFWSQFAYSGNPNKEIGVLPDIRLVHSDDANYQFCQQSSRVATLYFQQS